MRTSTTPRQSAAASDVEVPGTSPAVGKTSISCIACKQRKKRCDRLFPCSTCIEFGIECVPGTRAPYSYRRRNARAHPVSCPPASAPALTNDHGNNKGLNVSRSNHHPNSEYDEKSQQLWSCISEEFSGAAIREVTLNNGDEYIIGALEDPFGSMFTSSPQSLDLEKVQLSRSTALMLWETFLRNVHPLSKIVDVRYLQTKVQQDLKALDKCHSALFLSIYSTAIISMNETECVTILGSNKTSLLTRYLGATQVALTNAGVMKSHNLTVLQAFLIYLLTARLIYDSQTMWLMAGMAVRMGQRMDLHLENGESLSVNSEIRRRVWWQILMMDGRSTQLAGAQVQPTSVTPGYPLPLNVNDDDLNYLSDSMPAPKKGPTDMIFCLLRYEVGLYFANNGRKFFDPTSTVEEKDALINEFEDRIEIKYLRYCDATNPLHLISSGGARSAICKLRLMAHHLSQYSDKGASLPQSEYDMLFATSMKMVEYDVLGYTTASISGFLWHIKVYFQMDAFVFMLIESLKQRPGPKVDRAWVLVADVLRYHPELMTDESKQLSFEVRRLVARAWVGRVNNAIKAGLVPPQPAAEVLQIQERLESTQQALPTQESEDHNNDINVTDHQTATDDFPTSLEYEAVLDDNVLDWSHWMDLGV